MDWPENNEQLEWLWEHIEESGGKDHIMEALVKFLMIDGINDMNMPKIGSLLDLKPGELMKHAVKEENIVWALAHSLPQEYRTKAFDGLLEISEEEDSIPNEDIEDWEVAQDNSQDRADGWTPKGGSYHGSTYELTYDGSVKARDLSEQHRRLAAVRKIELNEVREEGREVDPFEEEQVYER